MLLSRLQPNLGQNRINLGGHQRRAKYDDRKTPQNRYDRQGKETKRKGLQYDVEWNVDRFGYVCGRSEYTSVLRDDLGIFDAFGAIEGVVEVDGEVSWVLCGMPSA